MKLKIALFTFSILLIQCKSKEAPVDLSDYANEIKEHRTKYLEDFINDPYAPLDSNDIRGVHFFEPDPAYVCKCSFKKLDQPQAFKMATYAGTVKDYIIYANLDCPINGENHELELYRSLRAMSMPMYRNLAFLPFRDLTNGESTYGGGRYIDVKLDTLDSDFITIDFNKTYNPYCAYSDGYFCPIPPIANHLEIAIKAGEKNYTGTRKQRKTDR
jgi:uncharacterized protein (DUF1684 family)